MTEQWKPNFTPDATSEKITVELFTSGDFDKMASISELEEWLLKYRENHDLEFIDVMQIRDYVTFEVHFFEGERRERRRRLAKMTEELMTERSVALPVGQE